jgi:hypothetical protein
MDITNKIFEYNVDANEGNVFDMIARDILKKFTIEDMLKIKSGLYIVTVDSFDENNNHIQSDITKKVKFYINKLHLKRLL